MLGMVSAQASSAAATVARDRGAGACLAKAWAWLVEHRYRVLASIAAMSVVVGGVLFLAAEPAAGRDRWAAAIAVLAAELAVEVVRTMIVDHHIGSTRSRLFSMVGRRRWERSSPG